MKRIKTAAGVVALMCILAGCGNTQTNTAAPAETTSATVQETTAAETTSATTQETTAEQTEPETEAATEGEGAEDSASSEASSEAQQYLDDLADSFRAYSAAAKKHAAAMDNGDVEGQRAAIDEIEAALGTFKNITVPEKYAEGHEKLLETVDKEYGVQEYYRKLADLQERMAAYDDDHQPTDEEAEELEALFEEVQVLEEKQNTGFAAQFTELIRAVKEDIG